MKNKKIPTLAAVIVVVLGIVAGLVLINRKSVFKLGAEQPAAPQDVRITNIADSSFTVSWTTANEATSFVQWGEGTENPSKTEADEVQEKGLIHSVTIRGLKPQSTYNFKINSNGAGYDNNGINWTVTTGASLPSPKEAITASGTVLGSSSTPSANTLVYVTIGGASPMSTVTSKSGSWIIPISTMRTKDLSGYLTIDKNNDILEVFVQVSSSENASAQAYVSGANPVPPIKIGQENDFKTVDNTGTGDNPEANLDIPESIAEKASKFAVTDATPTDSQEKVTLESIDSGEVISSTKPEFFGDGPKGAEITITVESEKIEGSTKVANSGTWKWSVPENLEPGIHKITISWRDDNGILHSISKSFVVSAAEQDPAFEATPSATPSTAPTSTPKSTQTPQPTSTGTAQPTIAPTEEPDATEPPVPDSGTLTPTLVLSIMGIALLILSTTSVYFAYKKDG